MTVSTGQPVSTWIQIIWRDHSTGGICTQNRPCVSFVKTEVIAKHTTPCNHTRMIHAWYTYANWEILSNSTWNQIKPDSSWNSIFWPDLTGYQTTEVWGKKFQFYSSQDQEPDLLGVFLVQNIKSIQMSEIENHLLLDFDFNSKNLNSFRNFCLWANDHLKTYR